MAKLYFDIGANYEEVNLLRQKLRDLEDQMLKTDAATDMEGLRRLQKEYAETRNSLEMLVTQAAKSGADISKFMGQMTSALTQNFADIKDSLTQGEVTSEQVGEAFDAMAEQVGAAVSLIGEYQKGLNIAIQENSEEIHKYINLANQADGATPEINEKLVELQRLDSEYRNLNSELGSYREALAKEGEMIDRAKEKYDALAERRDEINEIREDLEANGSQLSAELQTELSSLESSIEHVVGVFLKKGASLEQKMSALSGVFQKAGATLLDVKLNATQAAGGMNVFQAASQRAGVALVRMGMSANAARIALTALKMALPTAVITAAIAVITKLIMKWKEHRDEIKAQEAALKEYRDEISKTAAKSVEGFMDMKMEWSALSAEMEKAEFLQDRKKDLDKLGLAISSVAEAEKIFSEGTDTYIEAQIRKAEADVYLQKVRDKIADAVTKKQELDEADDTKKGYHTWNGEKVFETDRAFAKREYDALTQEIEDLYKKANEAQQAGRSLIDSIIPVGPEKPDNKTLDTEIEERKKTYEDALSWYNKVKDNTDKYTKKQLDEAKKQYEDAKKEYEAVGGDTGGGKKSTTKSTTDDGSERREKLLKEFGEKMAALTRNVENDITEAQIDAMADGEEKIEAQQRHRFQQMMDKVEEAGKNMQELYKGNVDLLNRPLVDASKLNEKGWDAGEGTATVFSNGIGAYDDKGKLHELLLTPILPDGSVLSPKELEDYVTNVLEGSEDFLTADAKGIVIAVDVPEDAGQKLHEMQEAYYDLVKKTKEYNSALVSQENLERRIQRSDDLYEKYKSVTDRRLEIDRKYEEEKAVLQEAYERTGNERYLRSLKELEESHRAALLDVMTDEAEIYSKIYANTQGMTEEMLRDIVNLSEQEIMRLGVYGSAAAEQIAKLRERADQVREEIYDKKYGKGGSIIKTLASIRDRKIEVKQRMEDNAKEQEALTSGKSVDQIDFTKLTALKGEYGKLQGVMAELVKEGFKALLTNADKVGEAVSSLGGDFAALGREVGSVKLEEFGNGLESLGNTITNVAKGFAQGGPLGAVLAFGKEVFGRIKDQIMEEVAATLKAKKAAEEYAYSLKLLALQVEETNNAFGRDNYGYAAEAWRKAKDALKEYLAQQEKALENLRVYIDPVLSATPEGRDLIDDLLRRNGILGEDGLDIGKVEELYKANNITDEEFEKLKELKALYDDLKKSVEDYVSSLVGETVGGIADEMIDGFLRTGSAIVDMTDNLNDFKRKLAESIVQSMLLQKVFTPEKQQKIADMLMSDNVPEAIEMFNTLLDDANAMSGEIEQFLSSINLTADVSQQSATAGAFQTMSQDTATELNGRFTALQISGENIESYMATLTMDFEAFAARYATQYIAVDDIRNIQAQALIELQGINENTLAALKPIRTMNDTMEEIRKKIEKL